MRTIATVYDNNLVGIPKKDLQEYDVKKGDKIVIEIIKKLDLEEM